MCTCIDICPKINIWWRRRVSRRLNHSCNRHWGILPHGLSYSRRFRSAGVRITLLRAFSSIWTARHSSQTRRVRTKPKTRSGFPPRTAPGNEYNEYLLRCPDARGSTFVILQFGGAWEIWGWRNKIFFLGAFKRRLHVN